GCSARSSSSLRRKSSPHSNQPHSATGSDSGNVTREDLLNNLAAEIVARKLPNKPLKVGIDGRSASGKSTLGDQLGSMLAASGLDILRPSVDGFHHSREPSLSKRRILGGRLL